MFAGIIENIGTLSRIERSPDAQNARLEIAAELFVETGDFTIGESIAVSGICLTLISIKKGQASFDVSSETLRCSTLGSLTSGMRVNLERSLKLGERIHGHLVFGHIDTVTKVLEISDEAQTKLVKLELPRTLNGLVVAKGSVSLDGVSLTVGEVGADTFSVYVIPHTAKVTTLADVRVGSKLNLEVDMLARYVRAQLGLSL